MIRSDLFTFVVQSLRYGATLDELSETLHQCVEASRETGKVSSLTLELRIKPNGASGQFELLEKIKAKIPEGERGVTLMFASAEGNLTREDPRQMKLELREVPSDKPAELKTVAN